MRAAANCKETSMTEKSRKVSWYYAVVGENSNINQGLARLLAAILAFLALMGFIIWVASL